ncbi:MAG TPA: ABC transporter permease [bacterium]|nr:ABC transporter permease [bacterium]
MTRYLLRRILHLIPLVLGITLISFIVMQLAPGDYLDQIRQRPEVSPETVARMSHQFGLDRPAWEQYLRWLWGILRGDLGYSFAWHVPVATVIAVRLGNTLLLTVTAMALSWLIAIPLGVYAALRNGSPPERALGFFAFVLLAIPEFFLAFLLICLAARTGWFPTGGMVSSWYDELGPFARLHDLVSHLIIPAGVLAAGSAASLQRYLRSNLLEILHQPFITALRARGLASWRIHYRHALRLALNPLITMFGYQLSGLFSGAALVEIITGWPGMGSLMLEAVIGQDLYLVMASMLVGAVLLVLGNLLADILLALADPRVRLADKAMG